ncbi:MAG: hypothetical protein LBT66_05635 [Methanobrevibacter sp.]|jgi:hypothetical protein|nr:hypothetical protein [Candidatus Methanovirga meridionalis]
MLKFNDVFLKLNNKNLMKFNLIKDNKGNIFMGLYLVMIIFVILIAILILNLSMAYTELNNNQLNSKTFNYILNDYQTNIPTLSYNVLENLSNNVVENKVPLINSKESIKEELEKSLLGKNNEYYKNSGIQIESHVIYIGDGEDPFHINIKTMISAYKNNMSYNNQITSEVSIENLKDPLPAIKCGKYPNFSYNDTNYNYGDSLSKYLESKNQSGAQYYTNGSSPLIIKKCIYEPYTQHGAGISMENCLKNGYYHESRDGSCYFHRLEGVGQCSDYGMETFVMPNPKLNQSGLIATSSPDHVIFGYSYPGESLLLNSYSKPESLIFLDDSHRQKYGLF